MPERDIRIRVFIDDSNIKALASMTTMLQQAAAAEKKLMRSAINKNAAIKKQAQVVGTDSGAIKKASANTRTWTENITRNIGKVAEWAVATGLLYGSLRTLRTAFDDILAVEFAMSGLTKVMQDGRERSKALRGELLALGQQYGELGTAVIDASTEFARLQLSNYEIIQNAETALLAQAVAEMSVVDASKYLIASMQQFERSSLENIRTLDQWNELSNRMAVRALDLAQATARAGSVIHNTGDDMAYLNGMTAALVQATGRSGQEIGNAIRTFGTYAYRLRSVNLLTKLGIDVRNEATGQLRSFSKLIGDTAVKWVTFSDSEQRAIAQAIAGTRRQNEFLTLMREYPEVLRASEIALNSMGSAEEEAAIRLDTAQKKAEQLRAGMMRLMAEFSNTKPLKLFLDALNALINALIEAKVLVALFGVAMVGAIVTTDAFKGALLKLQMAITGMSTASAVFLGIAAAVVVLTVAYAALNREAENYLATLSDIAQKAVEEAKLEKTRAETLTNLIAMYRSHQEALAKATDPAKVKELTDAMEVLAKRIETSAQAADKLFRFNTSDEEGSLQGAAALVDNLSASYDKKADAARKSGDVAIKKAREEIWILEEYEKQLEAVNKEPPRFWDKFLGGDRQAAEEGFKRFRQNMRWTKDDAESFIEAKDLFDFNKVYPNIAEVRQALADVRAELSKVERAQSDLDPKEVFQEGEKTVEDYREQLYQLRQEMDKISESHRHMAAMAKLSGATQSQTLEMVGDGIRKQIGLAEQYKQAVAGDEEATAKFDSILDSLNQKLRINANRIKEAKKAYEIKQLTDYISAMTAVIKHQGAMAVQSERNSKDIVGAAEAELQNIQERVKFYKALRQEVEVGSSAHKDLTNRIEALNREYELKAANLQDNIKVQAFHNQLALLGKWATDKLTESNRQFNEIVDDNNKSLQRRTAFMQANNASAVAVAMTALRAAQANLKLAASFDLTEDSVKDLINALKDAEAQLGIALLQQQYEALSGRLDDISTATKRQIELARAWGASGVDSARMRVKGLEREKQAIESSTLSYAQRQEALKDWDREHDDSIHKLAVAEANAARQATDNWIREYERRRAAWEKIIVRGMTKGDIKSTLTRISDEMIGNYVKNAMSGVVDFFAAMEMDVVGMTPAEEIENAFLHGGADAGRSIHDQMINAGNIVGSTIASAISQETGGKKFVFNPKTYTDGGEISGNIIKRKMEDGGETAGKDITKAMKVSSNEWASEIGAVIRGEASVSSLSLGQTATAYGLTMGTDIAGNMKDWTQERGGGWRAAGYGIGAVAGGILSEGNPAGIAAGARIGESVVSIAQDIKHWLWKDEEDKTNRAQPESLREQIGDAINRGTFGSAAQITYHTQNTINMSYMIPDREQGRRVVAWLKQNMNEYSTNVTVG